MYRQKSATVHCNSEAVLEVSKEHTAFFFVIEDKASILKLEAVCVL
jgi:hypothetical protein